MRVVAVTAATAATDRMRAREREEEEEEEEDEEGGGIKLCVEVDNPVVMVMRGVPGALSMCLYVCGHYF